MFVDPVARRDSVDHALAAAIQKLWDDAAQAAKLGQDGRQFALANCTESKTIAFVRDMISLTSPPWKGAALWPGLQTPGR